jgi:methylphosphotriester-DNA--protein-cysteine methyltransferase
MWPTGTTEAKDSEQPFRSRGPVLGRDARADGIFFYSVETTGIF